MNSITQGGPNQKVFGKSWVRGEIMGRVPVSWRREKDSQTVERRILSLERKLSLFKRHVVPGYAP